MKNLLEGGQFKLHDIYAVHPDWMLNKTTDEEWASVVTEFKCSLFDDLLIALEDVFERVN